MFSLDEGTDVGRDDGTPVSPQYNSPFAFNGSIQRVTLDVQGQSAADRAISERLLAEAVRNKRLAD
jgi:arylsulfatase